MSPVPKVLIIDDEREVGKVLLPRLNKSGFIASAVASGIDALEYLKKEIPDIIIMDIEMPDMDGYTLLAKIRSDRKTAFIPVIMLTADQSSSNMVKCLDLGADDYITKPFEAEEFISRVNAVLRRSKDAAKNTINNILVTGGAGFIGSHLARVLVKMKYNVYVLDDFSTGREKNIEDMAGLKNFNLTRGSVTDEALISKLIDKVDMIYHLAATVGVKNVVDRPLDTIINDTYGTELVLKYASQKHIKVFLTSTSEVYGKSDQLPFREDNDVVIGPPDVNRWSYACSKLLDEFLTIAYHKERNLPVVVVRLFNIVGPGQVGNFGMVIPRFFYNAFNNKPLVIYGDGKQSRCFTYVEDAVEIIIRLANSKDANGQLINLGSNNNITISDLAQRIINITGSSSQIKFEDYEKYYGTNFEDIRKRIPDLRKLERILNFIPSTSMDDILIKMKKYYTNHPEELNIKQ